ncbi:hypothetical protein [Hymenobacter arizonensis]|uniref:Uncharacterized protein n=1 Tax=Hymenobacter arizonensis TaxID=1227077 RepID=A0A1I6BF74_HYMAR|nr:hypothetical protein [Hymenobacter arizonensis]SFQ79593.1 hypothetical protein SAMN04515668_4463 [Hymenobacter arizonensis]
MSVYQFVSRVDALYTALLEASGPEDPVAHAAIAAMELLQSLRTAPLNAAQDLQRHRLVMVYPLPDGGRGFRCPAPAVAEGSP